MKDNPFYQYRKKLGGISQGEAARNFGFNAVAWSHYENRKRKPRMFRLEELAEAFGMEWEDLMEWFEKNNNRKQRG